MADNRTRAAKLAAMAGQTASPREAEIAARKLEREMLQPDAPSWAETPLGFARYSQNWRRDRAMHDLASRMDASREAMAEADARLKETMEHLREVLAAEREAAMVLARAQRLRQKVEVEAEAAKARWHATMREAADWKPPAG